tara:strand:- start:663 stop:1673 length:1011 start_codon:yes stop_codon:yes gene_type:complete
MNVGIIGLGHGSRVLIDSFRISKINVYGIASKKYNNALLIGKKKKIEKIYKHWKNLINDEDIDIVAIAVPPIFQNKIVRECVNKKKIIFCEKPIGINIKSVNKIFSLLSNYKKNILVNYMFQEHEAFKVFKNLLRKKRKYNSDIVDVKFYTQTYANKHNLTNWKSNDKKGGGLINLFLPHIFDYLVYFFGNVNKKKIIVYKESKSKLHLVVDFESEIKANIFIDTNYKNQVHSIKYFSKNFKLILENKGKDYCKNFRIHYQSKSEKKYKDKEIKFNNNTKKYNKDARILLTSKIINKLKKPYRFYDHKKNLERFLYNENLLNIARLSLSRRKRYNN